MQRTASSIASFAGATARSPRRRGFTLFELLAVTAILAVLASLLIPVVGMVRDAGRAVRCMSGLRQIGVAQLAYVADQRGFTVEGFEDGREWKRLLTPYMEVATRGSTGQATKAGMSILGDCPSWRGNFNGSSGSAGFGSQSRGAGYSYNAFPGRASVGGDSAQNSQYLDYLGRPYGHPYRLAQITWPTTRLQFFDSDSRMVDAIPSRMVRATMEKTGGPRHRAGSTWVFWDGHGERRWTAEMRIWKQRGDFLASIGGGTSYSVDHGARSLYFYTPETNSELWKAINRPDR